YLVDAATESANRLCGVGVRAVVPGRALPSERAGVVVTRFDGQVGAQHRRLAVESVPSIRTPAGRGGRDGSGGGGGWRRPRCDRRLRSWWRQLQRLSPEDAARK